MLKTQNLTFAYDSKWSFQFPDLECPPHETLLIVGKSGCGKTTLLQLLAGLLKPKAGHIWVGKTDIGTYNESQMDKFRGKNIGIVFQTAHFIASLNLLNNLLLCQKLAGVPKDKTLILNLLEELQIGHKRHAFPHELSVGEQQRAGIVRAVLTRPALLLADEPTSGLDDENCAKVLQILQSQTKTNPTSLLIVTHDQRLLTMAKSSLLNFL